MDDAYFISIILRNILRETRKVFRSVLSAIKSARFCNWDCALRVKPWDDFSSFNLLRPMMITSDSEYCGFIFEMRCVLQDTCGKSCIKITSEREILNGRRLEQPIPVFLNAIFQCIWDLKCQSCHKKVMIISETGRITQRRWFCSQHITSFTDQPGWGSRDTK